MASICMLRSTNLKIVTLWASTILDALRESQYSVPIIRNDEKAICGTYRCDHYAGPQPTLGKRQ
jgi:hypothetical protein